VAGLVVLCAIASMSAQAAVFDFTGGTYRENPINWSGGGSEYGVTKSVGLVVDDTAANWQLKHLTAVNATELTVGAVLHFSESGGVPSVDYRTLLAVGIANGMEIEKAVSFAIEAATISVTRLGDQASAPSLEQLTGFWDK